MPIATSGGALVLAVTGATADFGWLVIAAAVLVVAGAVLLRLRSRRDDQPRTR